MLTSPNNASNQYIRPDYLSPLPTTVGLHFFILLHELSFDSKHTKTAKLRSNLPLLNIRPIKRSLIFSGVRIRHEHVETQLCSTVKKQ